MLGANNLVHFVGSVPLKDSEEVFRVLSEELGPYIRRLPDGETGERLRWIVFQQRMLQEHPAVEVDPTQPLLPVKNWDGRVHREIALLRMKPDVDPDSVEFETGYDRAALQSYATFRKLRDNGQIPSGVRFQISLPTPMATGLMYVSPVGRERYLRAYERNLLAALRNILTALPNEDLAIQFDVCQEVLMFEGYFPVRPTDYKEQVYDQFGRLGAAVPEAAELGFHLCYGSPGDENLVRPTDATSLMELMNGMGKTVKRRLDFIHIPVPKVFVDETFFAPLRHWKRRAETHLYLGLIHRDDAEGNQKRIQAAKRIISEFGVATECGWGRSDPRRLSDILSSHRATAEALSSVE